MYNVTKFNIKSGIKNKFQNRISPYLYSIAIKPLHIEHFLLLTFVVGDIFDTFIVKSFTLL